MYAHGNGLVELEQLVTKKREEIGLTSKYSRTYDRRWISETRVSQAITINSV